MPSVQAQSGIINVLDALVLDQRNTESAHTTACILAQIQVHIGILVSVAA